MAQCPSCGAELAEPLGSYCTSCGAPLAAAPPPTPAPEPLAGPPPAVPTPPRFPGAGAAGPESGVAWERRDRLGLLNALVETTRDALMSPGQFFKRMPVSGGIGGPFAYGLLIGYVGLAVGAVYDAILRAVVGPAVLAGFGRSPGLQRFSGLLEGGVGLLGTLVLGPVFIAVGLFVSAGIWHLLLMLFGGARRGFEATFRVAAYIQAAAVLSILPFCGGLVGLVYRVVLAVIGLSEAHGIGKGTAAAAVLLPLVVIFCCCAGVATVVFLGGLASLGRVLR